MNYQETLNYLFEQLPMYQRTGKAAYKSDLANTLTLDKYFGHPHRKFRTIHVAGTNGKGSVSHMLASVLQSAGYRTGLYTSPHLLDFRERIKINGNMISEEEVILFVEQHRGVIERVAPSFFEMTVAMAFDYFSHKGVDVAIIEVGLGGRLDSTNIITPDLSVITNIGLDHTMFLGDTLEAIAGEKAGIIKTGVPVVLGRYQEQTASVFRHKAGKERAPLFFASDMVSVNRVVEKEDCQEVDVEAKIGGGVYSLPLMGRYQQENLVTVVASLNLLSRAWYEISEKAILSGIQNVVKNTGLMGRWQKISDNPLMVCDTGHNADGIDRVMEQLRSTEKENVHIVWGMVNDKDLEGVLRLLPENARYYFTKATIPRAMEPELLARAAEKLGLQGQVYENVKTAVEAAKKNASDNDLIFIGGSTFVVAEVLEK
ncbi:folylpolyglutamate synthase/dihydrofolate synthase family protein [Marinilabilia sp.]|uniref:bifunctional folylpolyglutamate synthase/dihydrofolate synthase n=1 Tax=Marinilabilia sp. TaxID=2021252 RepID=UPI0025C271C1|nr:folylpolyglutamate synthase/dihydrofolate synthase family protein [Marinilabilia sp.]